MRSPRSRPRRRRSSTSAAGPHTSLRRCCAPGSPTSLCSISPSRRSNSLASASARTPTTSTGSRPISWTGHRSASSRSGTTAHCALLHRPCRRQYLRPEGPRRLGSRRPRDHHGLRRRRTRPLLRTTRPPELRDRHPQHSWRRIRVGGNRSHHPSHARPSAAGVHARDRPPAAVTRGRVAGTPRTRRTHVLRWSTTHTPSCAAAASGWGRSVICARSPTCVCHPPEARVAIRYESRDQSDCGPPPEQRS